MTPELIGIITVGVMIVAQNCTAQREFRRDIIDLRERMARLEGLLEGLREAITHTRAA